MGRALWERLGRPAGSCAASEDIPGRAAARGKAVRWSPLRSRQSPYPMILACPRTVKRQSDHDGTTHGPSSARHTDCPNEGKEGRRAYFGDAGRGRRPRDSLRRRPSQTSSRKVPVGSQVLKPASTLSTCAVPSSTWPGVTKPSTMSDMSGHGHGTSFMSSGRAAKPTSNTTKSLACGAHGNGTVRCPKLFTNRTHSHCRLGESAVGMGHRPSAELGCARSTVHFAAHISQEQYPETPVPVRRERSCGGRQSLSVASYAVRWLLPVWRQIVAWQITHCSVGPGRIKRAGNAGQKLSIWRSVKASAPRITSSFELGSAAQSKWPCGNGLPSWSNCRAMRKITCELRYARFSGVGASPIA